MIEVMGLLNSNKKSLCGMTMVGSIPKEKRIILKRIEGIDRARQNKLANGLFKLGQKLWEEYNKLAG